MMPRKRKKIVKVISIVSIVIVILAVISAFVIVYLTTDMFKSNDVLFAKYLMQYSSIIEDIKKQNELEEIEQLLENNKYRSVMEGAIYYNKDNPINEVQLKIEGETDKQARVLL